MVLAGFVAVLAVVFGGSYLLGKQVPTLAGADSGPRTSGAAQTEMDAGMGAAHDPAAVRETASAEHGDEHGSSEQSGADNLPGLAMTQVGYAMQLVSPNSVQQGRSEIRFRIVDPDGRPVTRYTRAHEKNLHLIVVPRDLSGFRHLHPELAADGAWSVDVDFDRAGSWRAYADFTPTALDRGLVLGTDLTVAGTVRPPQLPEPALTSEVDGYTVTLAGQPKAGAEAGLTFSVAKDGRPVSDLTPYLGADGHLVALRAGDLAYLHTHPQSHEPTGGPDIRFATTLPSAGSYRVFLDFSHAGAVHTAAFTVTVQH